MEQGWVKFYREWLDEPTINKDAEHAAVWMYLMLRATHTQKDCNFGGQRITLKKGQLLIQHKEIYEKYHIEPCKLRRILNSLKNNYLIDYQTDKHKTLITLARWDFFQYENDYLNDDVVTIKRLSEQETENEKEKRSKREKEKEKEINKNDKNERIYNPLYPPRDEVTPLTSNSSQKEELFDLFWSNYPKKVGKGYAKACFDKIKPNRELVDTMVKALGEQKKSEMWKRDNGQYIPNPSTWLNQQRWLDNLEIEIEDDNPWKNIGIRV